MKIFTIVVIYNGMRNTWIQKCFDSVINSTVSCEIVAIDNNSTDDSVNYIKNNYPDVQLIVNNENKGFGGANNQGLKYALENGGEYFFLLNQDASVDPNTIEELVKCSRSNLEYGIISPIHLNGKGDALDFNFSNYIVPNRCKDLYSDFVLNRVQQKIYESEFICAAAWLVTKESLEKVGGFSPTFFHYAEDDNYVHRLHYKGLKIGIYPHVYIFHDRENRDNIKFFNKKDNRFRETLLQYSNPNLKQNIENVLKYFRYQIIKYCCFLNFKEAKNCLNQRKEFLEIISLTQSNLELSKDDSPYKFLG